jgi:phosphatidate phosphatase APP1
VGLFDRLRRADPTSEPYRYPLDRTQERSFSPDFTGDLHIWDIDETYLATDIDSLKGMLSVPLDRAVDKRNVAGTDLLLRALRRGPDIGGPVRSNPLYFVSASPPQMRRVIQKKMLLDGVEFDGITFKDQLALLRAGRVSALKHHVAYKLSALLLNRAELPWEVTEWTFGDDTETDALIYALYADIVAGRLRGPPLASTLRLNGCETEDCSYVARLAGHLRS